MYSTVFLILYASFSSGAQDHHLEDAVARGAQVRLTKSGLQYLADIEVEAFKEDMTNYKVPDQKGGGEHFTFSATNITIEYLRVESQSIKTIPNVGLSFAVGGITLPASATLHLSYKKGWIKLRDTTNVEIFASGMDFSLGISVNAVNGKPHVQLIHCSSNITDIRLHFHGGLSWLYELLRNFLETKLKNILNQEVCKQGTVFINTKGNKVLQKFPVRTNIKDYAYIDYSFQKPLFTPQYADLYLKGEFLDYKHPVHSKLVPTQFETTSSSSKMIYIWFSDYSLNTAAEVFHKAQLMKRVFKIGDEIPPGLKPFLNTKSLKEFIPQLYKKYPDRPIQIGIETFKPPRFKVSTEMAYVEIYVRAGINVIQKNKELVEVFHIDISVSASGSASIQTIGKEMNIGGAISSYTFKLDVGGSLIGLVKLPLDNKSVKDMVRGLVVDQVNPLLDRGFPLPRSNHLELKEPRLTLVRNAIRIDAMVEYHLNPDTTIFTEL